MTEQELTDALVEEMRRRGAPALPPEFIMEQIQALIAVLAPMLSGKPVRDVNVHRKTRKAE